MNFRKRRRLNKWTRQVLHEARHARHMREDLADPEALAALRSAEEAARSTWKSGAGEEELNPTLEAVAEASNRVYPPRSHPRIRENVEIFVVAICIAMGFRTYFVQPFKIPTGSMQPTLYGIQVQTQGESGLLGRLPLPDFIRNLGFIVTGERRVTVKAKRDGYVSFAEDRRTRKKYLLISDTPPRASGYVPRGVRHRYYDNLNTRVQPGERVKKGDVLASGLVTAGDHIFVDKLRYNFTQPQRGQIVVFRTDEIRHPLIQTHDHYIKRLAGLPNETISLQPPFLLVDGEKVVSPEPFKRLVSADGYNGYQWADFTRPPRPKLVRPGDAIQLGPEQFLPLGDNTNASLDGRYFGGVPTQSLIGPAFAVYWPFGPRWGWVK